MKKFVLLLLAVGLIAAVAVGCGGTGVNPAAGAGPDASPDLDENEGVDEGLDINIDDIVLPGQGDDGYVTIETPPGGFFQVGGKVVSVDVVDGRTHIEVEDSSGSPAILIICDETTVFPFADTVEVGEFVTGWHSSVFLAAIYPPQYNIEVLAAGVPDGVNVRVDRFHSWDNGPHEGYMISQNDMIAFNIDENTEIVLQDGQDFSGGDLENRNIIVIYGISTRSIPEQTTADKLIVLFEEVMALA